MRQLTESDITQILSTLSDGDRSAATELLPLVYGELRSLAGRYLKSERPDHTLQATALVHEAYVKIAGGTPQDWQDRQHFFRVAAAVMRHILVNHARDRARLKRGGNRKKLPLDDAIAVFEERAIDLIALDESLDKLSKVDKRLARVVELRFFGGLSVAETAELLAVSDRTIESNWSAAKLWLLHDMDE